MITQLTDPNEIDQAVRRQRQWLQQRGWPEKWAEVGVVFEDQYIRVIRDAVRFENGNTGTYIRIEYPEGVRGGVVIVPRQGGELLLLQHYRYATGNTHLEFPRGFLEAQEEPADGALRELMEETGASPQSVRFLGRLFADSGLMGVPVYTFLADVDSFPKLDSDESISGFVWISIADFMEEVRSGRIDDGLTLAAAMLFSAQM